MVDELCTCLCGGSINPFVLLGDVAHLFLHCSHLWSKAEHLCKHQVRIDIKMSIREVVLLKIEMNEDIIEGM